MPFSTILSYFTLLEITGQPHTRPNKKLPLKNRKFLVSNPLDI